MQMIFVIIVLAFFCIYGYLLYIKKKETAKINEQKIVAEKQRLQKLQREYDEHLALYANQINILVYNTLTFKKKYCSFTDLLNKFDEIKSTVPIVSIPKHYVQNNDLHIAYKKILEFLKEGESLRNTHNTTFIEEERLRCQNYFNELLSNPLDVQQIDAILHDDDNILVIAGAGCGKTTTVQGKVNYLLNNNLTSSNQILLLSFAKKSADDLKEKLGYLGVECRTFHSLAYQIIKENDRPVDIMSPDESEQLIVDIHHRLTAENDYLSSFNDFVINDLRQIKNENEFESYKDYMNYLKDSEFQSIKGMLSQKRFSKNSTKKTLNNEYVKSAEECFIANFLFLNGVEYSYESPYIYQEEIDADVNYDKHKKRYRPDFAIFMNGYNETLISSCLNPNENIIYLEHYGIDEKGNTPQFFQSKDGMSSRDYYKNIMEWKDEIHNLYNTNLIKSYSYEFKNNSIEENLINNLISYGIKLKPKSNVEVYEIIQEAYGKEIDAVITLIKTFIGLYKSNNKSFEEIISSNIEMFSYDYSLIKRNEKLLDIIQKIFISYQQELERKKKIDFNDLINYAKKKVENNSFIHQYQYIIVDEFQDISINRYELLNSLKKQKYCKLFAVGDDWQSIYRFTGSDLTLFSRFENFFGHTVTKRIETTYRFADPLISISSQFVLKNPNQRAKKLRAGRSIKTDVRFDYNKSEGQPINLNILNILKELYIEYGKDLTSKSITILGRYNFDINQIEESKEIFIAKEKGKLHIKTLLIDSEIDIEGHIIRDNKLLFDRDINYLTVHKAKGLESDIVILINCETGKFGFPAELSDDKILNLLLSGDDNYPNGEERRAFYVALTRAKEKFYFLADKNRQSKFVREIYNEHVDYQMETLLCKKCDGELQFIKNISNKFGISQMFGCRNYKYGCDYTCFLKDTSSESTPEKGNNQQRYSMSVLGI
ncbi:UvrD-helicase domain-containing protein [Sphingobacterium sp. B29]|uniref:UvrD-helicase domain-containing protein n=1 Tax=Sphingobacterium sp. B29 TaxID=1933220 RepID=UPI001560A284|nr:UvrD-helicase domain-containing protein [Sphingobacterium sp. B29]